MKYMGPGSNLGPAKVTQLFHSLVAHHGIEVTMKNSCADIQAKNSCGDIQATQIIRLSVEGGMAESLTLPCGPGGNSPLKLICIQPGRPSGGVQAHTLHQR